MACAVGQDPPHGLDGSSEEVGSVLAGGLRVTTQTQPRFVDQGGRLEVLAGPFVGLLRRRNPAQLVIDQRQQLLGGLGLRLDWGAAVRAVLAYSSGKSLRAEPRPGTGIDAAASFRSGSQSRSTPVLPTLDDKRPWTVQRGVLLGQLRRSGPRA